MRSLATISLKLPSEVNRGLIYAEDTDKIYVNTGTEFREITSGDMSETTDLLQSILDAITGKSTEAKQDDQITNEGTMISLLGSIGTNTLDSIPPTTAFGELLVSEPTPVFQLHFVQNQALQTFVESQGNGGSITYDNQLVSLSSGTGIGGYGTLRSKRFLRYRSGQGIRVLFTALFDTANAVANSIQLAGMGHAEGGVYFGYDGTNFGINRHSAGRQEIQVFEITTASTTAENVTVTLNGVGYSVPVTNSGSVNTTATEISAGTYTSGFDSWQALACDQYVVFVHLGTGVKGGAYSLTATTAIATITQNQAGVANTHEWTHQASWNGEELGFTLDPAMGNVYQIQMGYLGFAGIKYFVKSPVNQKWVLVHTIKFENSSVETNTQDPSFQGLIASASLGSTTDITVKSGSISGQVEGKILVLGEPNGASVSKTGLSTGSSWQNLLTIRVCNTYGPYGRKKVNRGQILLSKATIAAVATKACEFAVFKNATLAATNPEFTKIEDSMCCEYSGDTTVTGGTPIIETGVAREGNLVIDLEQQTEFGEALDTYTLAFRQVPSGGAPDATASLNWKEDI